MLRMTKQADYGIVLMTYCASRPGQRFAAPELAAETRLPAPTVSKILKLLAREGLLESHRGVKGGYSLARRPEQITVAARPARFGGIKDSIPANQLLLTGQILVGAQWTALDQNLERIGGAGALQFPTNFRIFWF